MQEKLRYKSKHAKSWGKDPEVGEYSQVELYENRSFIKWTTNWWWKDKNLAIRRQFSWTEEELNKRHTTENAQWIQGHTDEEKHTKPGISW